MAQCKLTSREFISNAFSPQVGAVCSPIAESVCQKNNLSFIELLQPFCNLNTEGHFKDPQGTIVTVRNLRLSIQDIHAQPPEPSVARKMLNDSVSLEPCERMTVVQIGSVDLEIPMAVPWFEAWREMFLSVQFPSDHEFTKHFLACMIVVSTLDENPLEKIQQMAAQLHQSIPGKLPKWFNNNALRYYILIHDSAQDDKAKAEAVFTEMKNMYDANNCFFLQINSRPPGHADDNTHLPDPWSQFLVKHNDFNASSEHSSSPRTPADTGGVSAMPNEVTTEPDKTSHAGTPIAPQNPGLISPDFADKISLSSEVSESPSIHVELGQEAVPVTIHPLSPEGHKVFNVNCSESSKVTGNESSPINANVWADSPNHPVAQHGARLSTQDLDRIRSLINEFCLRSLLPYVEKQIGLLSDVISNKKGVSRSLFSATKRWFGTSKPGVPGSAPTNAVIYTAESPELQLRRLGDLCFMFGHYTLAYQAYHSAKRDFAADQAWLYYAGALEMAALSAFMQSEVTRKTIEYMDDAILTYSNSCKMPQFATRATLLSAECLKGRSLHGDAAKQLIRMTSEDSDLRSALLLEQAAYCFINPKMIHKYAFHAVLAGHRFSKAGQRKHSLRCYQQAYQVYRGRGWSSAEDHIHFTIGRQAASLKQVGDAVRAFEKLLNASSKQPSAQQAAFLREFLHTHHLLLQETSTDRHELPILPLPLVDGNEIKVLLGPLPRLSADCVAASNMSFDNQDEDETRWSKLEEIMMTEAQGSSTMIFKPTIALYSNRSNNSVKPNAVLDEPIHLSIELYNPLRIPIPLAKVKLIWAFTKENETITNETIMENTLLQSSPVDTETLESVLLQPTSKQRIVLSCIPREIGELKILGLCYDLSNPTASDQPIVNPTVAITGKRLFEIKGPRLKNVKEKPGTNIYGDDCRLNVNIVDRAPYLQVSFSKISAEMLCGEMQRLEVTLENIGKASLKNIYVGSTNPKLFCLEDNGDKIGGPVTKIRMPESDNGVLEPGKKHVMPLWIRAPHTKGSHRLDLLFYYENVDIKSLPKYRLCRHTWQLTVLESIQISAITRRSAVRKNDLPTLTLTVRVKNTNQVYDPFMNEIALTRVSLESSSWSLLEYIVEPSNIRIQPQETYCILLKLIRRTKDSSRFSDVSLNTDQEDTDTVTTFPYLDFIQKRHIRSQLGNESQINETQFRSTEESPLAVTMRLDATLILRWRAKVTETGAATRHALGQHHVDLALLNKYYKHPEEARTDQADYSTRLKIFGPDRNVPDSTTVVKRDQVPEIEYKKNIVSFSLSHVREGKHNFERSRMCIIPVSLHLQNHSESPVDIKVCAIGTDSQTFLPNIKSQLYSHQASTFFRYASHTAINCHIDPLGLHTIKLQAIIPSPGTYDLASRLDISAKVENSGEFISQKWRMDSVCSISDASV